MLAAPVTDEGDDARYSLTHLTTYSLTHLTIYSLTHLTTYSLTRYLALLSSNSPDLAVEMTDETLQFAIRGHGDDALDIVTSATCCLMNDVVCRPDKFTILPTTDKVTHSLTYSLTHSLTLLLTHSYLLTYLLTHSNTRSLSYSLTLNYSLTRWIALCFGILFTMQISLRNC